LIVVIRLSLVEQNACRTNRKVRHTHTHTLFKSRSMKITDYMKDVKADVISNLIYTEMSCKFWGMFSPGSKCKQSPVEVISIVEIFRICCNFRQELCT